MGPSEAVPKVGPTHVYAGVDSENGCQLHGWLYIAVSGPRFIGFR